MRTTVWVAAVAMLGITMPAGAQERKVEVNLGGGYSAVTGEAREHTGDAGVFEAGVTFNITPTLGFKTNYNYTGLGKEKTVTLPVTNPPGAPSLQEFSADSHMNDVTFDFVMKAPPSARVAPYGLVGPGIYHRTVSITTPAVELRRSATRTGMLPGRGVGGSGPRLAQLTDFGMNFGEAWLQGRRAYVLVFRCRLSTSGARRSMFRQSAATPRAPFTRMGRPYLSRSASGSNRSSVLHRSRPCLLRSFHRQRGFLVAHEGFPCGATHLLSLTRCE